MLNKPVIIIGRLLTIERLSRELVELVADQANHADGKDARQARMDAAWAELLSHVAVIENTSRTDPRTGAPKTAPAEGN